MISKLNNMDYNQESVLTQGLSNNTTQHILTAARRAKWTAIISIASAVVSFASVILMAFKSPALAGVQFFQFLLVSGLSIILAIFLWNFNKNVKEGLVVGNNDMVEKGMGNLMTYFKIIGILVIVLICIIVLFILISIISGLTH